MLESKDTHYGRTPLSWAAENGHEVVVKLLLEQGAELESKDTRYGRTPLSWAAENGHEAVVKLLLEQGAQLESKDTQYGRTPLLWAAGNGHEGMVQLLLEQGANINVEDKSGLTALQLSSFNFQEEIEWLLIRKGASICQDFYGLQVLFQEGETAGRLSL